ncbi:hypothetical protein RclHR1_03700005 [Rhizophagus clarus]|uniref:Uncharacterized protein n=1 Tax=Rhizophagus clarus TaxID=94130 RepID=A0A2Z6RBZ5_9GLOM|nr:hypothetical protein RclHR1_03700005 [Rhizophagus clarus]GES72642.1 hypothetical protein RCL_jg15313.t1 [Rhizophagus clarus]
MIKSHADKNKGTNASEVAKGFKEYPKEFMSTLISIIVVRGGAYELTQMIRKEINGAVKSIEVKVDSINSNTNERLGRLENQLLKFADTLKVL